MGEPTKAVFLSYASQDADVARRVCEALRAAGVEVWFDLNELRGGDAWDQKIRRQIRECALFMPLITANTNARPEGYFRLEWKLAVDRSHLMADDEPFLFPIAAGDFPDSTARVPDKFREVQWTRLRLDETPAELARRVAGLLDPAAASVRVPTRNVAGSAKPAPKPGWVAYWWIIFPIFGVTMAIFPMLRVFNSSKRTAPPKPALSAPAVATTEADDLAKRALTLLDLLDASREDYTLAEDLVKQAKKLDNTNPIVAAAEAQVQSRFIVRGFDRSEHRRELFSNALQRALRLDPKSYEARLAEAQTLSQFGREPELAEKTLNELLRERPNEPRALRSLAMSVSRHGEIDKGIALLDQAAAQPGGDPLALYNKAWTQWYAGRAADAQATIKKTLEQKTFGSALLTSAYFSMLLQGDLDAAKADLERLPREARGDDRSAVLGAEVYRWRREPERAMDMLQSVTRDWLDDAFYRGPKNSLAGDALSAAGRTDAAQVMWRSALAVVESRIAAQPNDISLLLDRAYLLAMLGDKDRGAEQLRAWEQISSRTYSVRSPMPPNVRRIYLQLGRKDEVIAHLKELVASPLAPLFNLTPAALRLDPDWDSIRNDPGFQALSKLAKTP